MASSVFESLFCKRVGQIKPGLERMRAALTELNLDETRETNILVGGTNGKGGTSSFLWTLLNENEKLESGLFTSPHLVSFRERFRITNKDVTDDDLIRIWEYLKLKLSKSYDDLSFFELSTVMGRILFQNQNLGAHIYEVGLGGRLDSTNTIEPDLTIITSISRDHEAFLGSDLLGILKEKMGICRAGIPLVWGNGGEIMAHTEALQYIEQFTKENNIPLFSFNKNFGISENMFFIENETFRLPNLISSSPQYIQKNFATACMSYKILEKKLNLRPLKDTIDTLEIGHRIASPAMVARYQRLVYDDIPLILDVCHNPDGLETFIQGLKKDNFRPFGLVSILNDKDYTTMLDRMLEEFEDLILFSIDDPRTLNPKNLDSRHSNIKYAKDFAAAFALGKSIWPSEKQPWVICGSVLALGKVLDTFEKDPLQFTYNDVLLGNWPIESC